MKHVKHMKHMKHNSPVPTLAGLVLVAQGFRTECMRLLDTSGRTHRPSESTNSSTNIPHCPAFHPTFGALTLDATLQRTAGFHNRVLLVEEASRWLRQEIDLGNNQDITQEPDQGTDQEFKGADQGTDQEVKGDDQEIDRATNQDIHQETDQVNNLGRDQTIKSKSSKLGGHGLGTAAICLERVLRRIVEHGSRMQPAQARKIAGWLREARVWQQLAGTPDVVQGCLAHAGEQRLADFVARNGVL